MIRYERTDPALPGGRSIPPIIGRRSSCSAELHIGFSRIAILVRSAASALQINRHAREDNGDMRAFHGDLEAALAYLAVSSRRGRDA